MAGSKASTHQRRNISALLHVLRRQGDADNLLKITLDGLKDGIGIDDRYFTPIEASRGKAGPITQGAVIAIWQNS